MRRSTQDAHYTSESVVLGLWSAAQRLGFSGGQILEPSFGIGHFWGLMPTELRSRSQCIAVELDPVTARIAHHLYPRVRVHQTAFQQFATRDDSIDLAIGNPPFGSQSIFDAARPALAGLSIHNYFFARCAQALRPGGLLAMVVSSFLLDAKDPRAREFLKEHTRFLGAIRLPNTAFLANAGTEVTTDLVFLQRRGAHPQPDPLDWTQLATLPNPDGGEPIALNSYFAAYPEMILGRLQYTTNAFAKPTLTVLPTGDLDSQLSQAIARLPQSVYVPREEAPPSPAALKSSDIVNLQLGQQTKVFGYFTDPSSGSVFRRLPDINGDLQTEVIYRRTFGAADRDRQRLASMIELRNMVAQQLQLERSEEEGADLIEEQRRRLQRRYELFRGYFGYLHDPSNKSLMRDDPQWPLLLALEAQYDKGISRDLAATLNIRSRPRTAKPGLLLKRRVRWPHREPTHAASAKDGLLISLSYRGSLDLDYIQTLTGLSRQAIIRDLADEIFQLPTEEWQTRDAYLSGPVKDKLRAVEQLVASGRREFVRNVEALKKVQPLDLAATDIHVRLGAPWLPAKVMQDFASHLFGKATRSAFRYITPAGRWAFSLSPGDHIANRQTWGTDRRTGEEILDAIINNHPIRIYDQGKDDRPQLNTEATQAAQERANQIEAEFSNWLWRDVDRRAALCRLYNDRFNTHVERVYDGSHLGRNPDGTPRTLPGANPAIQLRTHQFNAIWRGIQERTLLADHVVGAGKTFVIIAILMELRRLGLIRRPMVCVPNHLVGQWASDFQKLYPAANILVPSKDDFQRERRQQLLGRIAAADWDAVIVAHTSFGFIDMPLEEFDQFISMQVEQLEEAIRATERIEGEKGRTVKQMEKLKDTLKERIRAKLEARQRDPVVDFSELGIDALAVDEAHEFKNLMFSTALRNVAGLGSTSGSQRAMDLFVKVRFLQRRYDGKNVFFATGTPISNSIAEMFTVLRFLAYDRLEELGMLHFDAWQTTFASRVTDWEIDSTATGYKLKERLASFNNLPELLSLYRAFSDVVTRDDIDAERYAAGLPPLTPPMHGGAPENIIAERSDAQARYMATIIERAEKLRQNPKGSDNMLVITGDARKAALDMRLVEPYAQDYAGGKVNLAVDRIFAHWTQWTALRGTQLVFCDLSTPRAARSREASIVKQLQERAAAGEEDAIEQLGRYSFEEIQSLTEDSFDVYNDLRTKLIAKGVPQEEIAFIHDANTDLERQDLFESVRAGRIRILVGSSRKMGAGMNVQTRLVALHHLDAPWKPMEVEQREGRICRQGNMFYEGDPELGIAAIANFEIHIFRYATRLTYDARMWQTIEGKARFITQLRRGCSERAAQDIAAQAANAAEMKAAASGNPLIVEEVQLRSALQRLESLRRSHDAARHRWQDTIRMRQGWKERGEGRITLLSQDFIACPRPADGDFAGMTVQNVFHNERRPAGIALISQIVQMQKSRRLHHPQTATYRGFAVSIELSEQALAPTLILEAPSGPYRISYWPDDSLDPIGITRRLDTPLDDLPHQIEAVRQQMQVEERELAIALEHVDQPCEREDEYQKVRARYGEVLNLIKSEQTQSKAA